MDIKNEEDYNNALKRIEQLAVTSDLQDVYELDGLRNSIQQYKESVLRDKLIAEFDNADIEYVARPSGYIDDTFDSVFNCILNVFNDMNAETVLIEWTGDKEE